MSRYKTGDVVWADYAFFDVVKGYIDFKPRPFIVIDIEYDTDNLVVICSTKTHQSLKYKGIVVLEKSVEGQQMGIVEDTFIYLDRTLILTNKEIRRKIGTCPLIDEIIEKLKS